MKTAVAIVLSLVLLVPFLAQGKVGVGVNIGKIEIEEPLKPGGVYNLPTISVINTGDDPGIYELEVTYHEDQPQLRPKREWFSFDPPRFDLAAGQSQRVAVKLTLPVKAEPGEYLAYLEAHPVTATEGGGAIIGIAAATKAYFRVEPANVWQALLHRISAIFRANQPLSLVVLVVVLLGVFIVLFRRFFSMKFGITRKKQ